ncbi:amidohydrolase [Brachybacterium endophyticum]|uniref:Amidohydrolase n=1 Tax=Brachybacterium endophyticum TaxID=2182385 RepID=A0A2U2RKS9_9MICO|nr:amidohydrolase [Brachybacterium endophyticum]PWH06441.1 amidohydrolase [Brachybacterium endophyticum]
MSTLFHSGRIITMVDQDDAPEAVLVEDGRIAGVGTLEELRARLAPGATVGSPGAASAEEVDLQGRTLMPSFIDPHGHLLQHGRLAALVDLEEARSIDDVVRAFRERLEQREAGDNSPLIGAKYDTDLLEERRHPTREDLDRISTQVPVLALHRSMHVGAANSTVVEAAGITAETPDPEGARFGRGPDGTPNGYAEEHAAIGAFVAAIAPGGQADAGSLLAGAADPADALRLATEDYLRHGITTAQEGAADPGTVSALADAAHAGELPLDLVVYPVARWGAPAREQFADFTGGYVGRLRLGGYKMILDGSPQARSAWMSEPYEPVPGDEDPGCAYGAHANEQVEEWTRELAADGVQLIAHCNGDAAAEQWIRTVERVSSENPAVLTERPVMIHAQTVRDDQLERMAKQGMIASIFGVHVYFWGDVHLTNFGPRRGRRISPARSALDRGVRVTLHQDSPVTPPDMLLTVWAAVNRVSRSGRPVGLEERISTWEALRAVTTEGAYQYGEEESKGQIREGMRADLVVLSADPLATAPDDLRDIQVLRTIKDGETVFTA